MTKKNVTLMEDPATLAEVARIVSDVDDRGWIVCNSSDCKHADNGKCTIFAMKDVLPMKPGVPCLNYSRLHGES